MDKKLIEKLKSERDGETRQGNKWMIKNREVLCLDSQGKVCQS